jgi:heme/copper-type cytochrome/quinol oxidase subunit 3
MSIKHNLFYLGWRGVMLRYHAPCLNTNYQFAGLLTYKSCLQGLEYIHAPFNISDGVYGSCFYMATGFHGFHVFIGTLALLVSLIRIVLNHFTNKHHVGFESAIWY